jgi:twitching motility protein PilI
MNTDMRNPLELLHRIEREARATAPGLPEQAEAATVWTRLGFRVGPLRMVVALDQVREVVPLESVTAVPGTKHWLQGVSNVRGDLLTIADLADFLGFGAILPDPRTRLMVLNDTVLRSGILVNEVLGLRHFYEEERLSGQHQVDAAARPYVRTVYGQGGETWPQFDLNLLAASDAFLHVAA